MKITSTCILSAVTALVFFSCTVSQPLESPEDGFQHEELTFEACMCETGVSPFTRTSAVMEDDDITSVLWTPGDKINVFFTAAGTVTGGMFTNKATSAADKASFSGSINIISGTFENPVSDQMFRAIYPYDKGNTCDGSAITFSIPAKQSCPAGTFADGQWPTMARSNGLNLPFYAVCSGIKFKVLNDNVTSVTFTNKDGGSINGTVTAGWDNNLPSISSVTDGTAQIVVTPEGTDTFTAGSIYFAVLPTVTMSEGIEVTYKTATSHCTYTNSGEINFTRNKFNTLYDKDEAYENDPVFTRVDEVKDGGMYIMVNNGMALQDNAGAFGAIDVSAALADDYSSINYKQINVGDITELVWTWTASTLSEEYGHYIITNGEDYLYVTATGSTYKKKYSLSLGTTSYNNDTKNYYVWDYTANNYVRNGKTQPTGSSSYRILTWKNNKWDAPNESSTTDLYEYIDNRTPQDLSFSSEEAEYDLGTATYTKARPTLSGDYHTAVTYTSSDPETASVANDGTVTPLKVGQVTITAKAAGSDTYAPASASYTLTVINSKAKYYRKYTESTLVDGTYIIVYTSSNSGTFMFNASAANYYSTIDIEDQILFTDVADGCPVEITSKDGKYFLKSTEGYIYLSDSSSSNLSFEKNNKDDQYLHTTASNNENKISFRNNSKYLSCSGTPRSFRYSSSQSYLTLYLLDGSAKAARNLAFVGITDNTVTKDINNDTDPFAIELTGVKTDDVEYTSSNTDVATVNQNGTVTIIAEGTTLITATAPETDDYRSETVSYTLKVIDPTKLPTYKKVSTVTSGKTYLIFSYDGTKALTYSSVKDTKSNHTSISVNSDEITAPSSDAYNDCEYIITADGDDYTFYNENNGKYLKWDTGSNTYLGYGAVTDSYRIFILPNGNNATSKGLFYFKSKENNQSSQNEWLYFNAKSGNNCFKIGGSGKPTDSNTYAGVILYEKQ